MQPLSQRDDEILAKKLKMLFASDASPLINLVVGATVVVLLGDDFPHPFLLAWTAAIVLVGGARVALRRWFIGSSKEKQCNICWVTRFAAGTFATGLLWGTLCLGLLKWGQSDELLLLTLVSAGMTAGALTTMLAYWPAYLAYAGPIVAAMASVSLMDANRYISANGWLILFYFVVLAYAAWNGSRTVNRGVALQVDLEEMTRSLAETRIERDKARSEKWATLGQLSHELRTPLNAIMGFSEAMKAEFFGPLGNARYKDYADHVHASGRHLMRLVEELLELTKSETGMLELKEVPVELDILVASCIDIMQADADAAQLALNRHLARGLPLVKADKTKLRQIVLNLLSNAIKFTPPGGTVILSAYPSPGGLAVAVQDTGIGMSEDDIAVALTPFGRVASPLNDAKPGMGLGLPMAKRLAELHGAELSIASEPGLGTRCTIWFPAERCLSEIAPPEGAVCAGAFAA